jgi:hypothetical protein
MSVVYPEKLPVSDQPRPADDATDSILARLKAIEERTSAVSQALGVRAEALIKDEGSPLTAALAAEVADRAEVKLVNSGLFKGARTAFAVILGVCVLMFGGSVAYFSFQLDSVNDRAEAAKASIQALAMQLQSQAGNVDSLAKLVSRIGLAALSRADVPESDRRDFAVYLDEFQKFSALSLATMLPELRKYHVGLVLAHQHLTQLEPLVRDAILGNVGTTLAFRVGATVALRLADEFAPDLTISDLLMLPDHNAYLKILSNDTTSRPFSVRTLDPAIPRLGNADGKPPPAQMRR